MGIGTAVTPAMLNTMYENRLGRAPDQAAINGWAGQSMGAVMNGIQNSPEYQQLQTLNSPTNAYVTGHEDYNTYAAQNRNANAAIGNAIHSRLTAPQAAPQKDVNGSIVAPGYGQAPTLSTDPRAAYGANYYSGLAANPFMQTPQGRSALATGQLEQQFGLGGVQRRQLSNMMQRFGGKQGQPSPQLPPQ